MRLTRKQVEAMAEAAQDTAASEFVLDTDAGGKVRFSAVEVVERVRPLALGKATATQKGGGTRSNDRVAA